MELQSERKPLHEPLFKITRLAGLLLSVVAVSSAATAATPLNYTATTKNFSKASLPDITLNLQPYLYATKFVCGQQLNAGVQIGQTVTYSALEPGVYSTALNLLTLRRDAPLISVSASMDGYGSVSVATQLSATTAFVTHTVSCDDILKAFNVAPDRDAYEGFLYVQRQRPDLRIDSVYTYASRDSFSTFFGVDYNGLLVESPGTGLTSVGGAGGLGLGASIDVQRVDPVDLNDI